jgi:cytochrome c oxidase assembly factor CtaG
MEPYFLALFAALAIYVYRRWRNRISLSDLPGPKADSWLLGMLMTFRHAPTPYCVAAGNMADFIQSEVGDVRPLLLDAISVTSY